MTTWISDALRTMRSPHPVFVMSVALLFALPAGAQPASAQSTGSKATQSITTLRGQFSRVLQPTNQQQAAQYAPVTMLKKELAALNKRAKALDARERALNRREQALAKAERQLRQAQVALRRRQRALKKVPVAPSPPARVIPQTVNHASVFPWTVALAGGVGVAGLALGWGLARWLRPVRPRLSILRLSASMEPGAGVPAWTAAPEEGASAKETALSVSLRGRLEIGEAQAPLSIRVVEEERDERT